ncbi:hypothetical protein tb265_41430 [Gemmatimonadetes bacterium T265]|nr:hypothetical protein tb265_40620 [Gemmatimonadetes bacterium T265]GJG88962.1 hypothetical protein tb265_41430 [Gemmatimonadetes bacterium T265]
MGAARPHAGHGLQARRLGRAVCVGGDGRRDLQVEPRDAPRQPAHVEPEVRPERHGGRGDPVLLGGDHRGELAPARAQRGEGARVGGGARTDVGSHALGVVGEHGGVDPVRLGAHAECAREVTHAVRAGDDDRQRGGVQGIDEEPLEAPSRIGDDPLGGKPGAERDALADARSGVGHAQRGAVGPNVHVERGLRHIDADEVGGHRDLGHGRVGRGGAQPCGCGLGAAH